MNKQEAFQKEISYIKNKDYQSSVKALLEKVPDYFFEIPASSTGKYHPKYALNESGLLRHTKVAITIAYSLLQIDSIKNKYTENERDLLLIALMFHDTIKSGNPKEEFTRFDHPLLAAQFIKDNQDCTSFTEEEIKFLQDSIKTHMGQWNTSSYSSVTLPLPKTKYQTFVHMCDYLASRKFLEVPFINNDIEE